MTCQYVYILVDTANGWASHRRRTHMTCQYVYILLDIANGWASHMRRTDAKAVPPE